MSERNQHSVALDFIFKFRAILLVCKLENTSYSAIPHIREPVPSPEPSPTNSGIPFCLHPHYRLYVCHYSLISKLNNQFPYGIPELESTRSHYEFLGIPGNSHQFLLDSNSGIPFCLHPHYRLYVCHYRLISKLNNQFRYGIPELESTRND